MNYISDSITGRLRRGEISASEVKYLNEQVQSAFADKEDTNWQIVWQMAVDGTFATGKIEDWLAEYDNRVIKWDLEIDNPQEIIDL
jgi:hypothetical protein